MRMMNIQEVDVESNAYGDSLHVDIGLYRWCSCMIQHNALQNTMTIETE